MGEATQLILPACGGEDGKPKMLKPRLGCIVEVQSGQKRWCGNSRAFLRQW